MFTGNKLRLLRTWKGLVQKQAASLMNVSQPAYCKMEKMRKINDKTLAEVKKAFKCTDEEIERFRNLPPPLNN